MSKQIWRGSALIAPVPPALVCCGDMDHPNILTVAWTGIIGTVPPRTYISVRPERYSYELIRQSGEFTINLATADMVRAVDFCGMYTGRKVDKFARTGLTPAPASQLACPILAESPLSFECRVTDILPQGSHDMFLADILATHVDDSLLDKKGKLCLDRAHLCAFAHGEYYELGKVIGKFGFSAAKPGKPRNK